jgi:hypothetical protein
LNPAAKKPRKSFGKVYPERSRMGSELAAFGGLRTGSLPFMAKFKQCQSVSKKDCIICGICVKNVQKERAKTMSGQENVNNYDMTPFIF